MAALIVSAEPPVGVARFRLARLTTTAPASTFVVEPILTGANRLLKAAGDDSENGVRFPPPLG